MIERELGDFQMHFDQLLNEPFYDLSENFVGGDSTHKFTTKLLEVTIAS